MKKPVFSKIIKIWLDLIGIALLLSIFPTSAKADSDTQFLSTNEAEESRPVTLNNELYPSNLNITNFKGDQVNSGIVKVTKGKTIQLNYQISYYGSGDVSLLSVAVSQVSGLSTQVNNNQDGTGTIFLTPDDRFVDTTVTFSVTGGASNYSQSIWFECVPSNDNENLPPITITPEEPANPHTNTPTEPVDPPTNTPEEPVEPDLNTPVVPINPNTNTPEMPANPNVDIPEQPINPNTKTPAIPTNPNTNTPEMPADPNVDIPEQPINPNTKTPAIPTNPNTNTPEMPADPNVDIPEQPINPNTKTPVIPTNPNTNTPEIPAEPRTNMPKIPMNPKEPNINLPEASDSPTGSSANSSQANGGDKNVFTNISAQKQKQRILPKTGDYSSWSGALLQLTGLLLLIGIVSIFYRRHLRN
ncbi:hypothetical protein IGI37_003781 [Enterococcus sp. AZ194]|uniref:hypothetical protein n=1 Tax=Enterococcus sp. AZ194 TaxID=2774629 RepID=UPI003F26618E